MTDIKDKELLKACGGDFTEIDCLYLINSQTDKD